MTICARQRYARAVVKNYVRLPGTPLTASRRDRELAELLYDRGIPLNVVWAAFVMAAARWALRSPSQPQLPPIRTLYYFLPAIDEALAAAPDPGYVQYLTAKLQPLIAEKDRILAGSPPTSDRRHTRQNSAVLRRR